MKKYTALFLVLMLLLSFCGCTKAPEQPAEPAASKKNELRVEAEFLRTNCTDSAFMWKKNSELQTLVGDYPFTVINDISELELFRKQAEFFHCLSYDWDDLPDLYSLITELDDAYFEQNILALVYVVDTSGSIRHKLADIYVENGCFYATVKEILPEGGGCTDDMAAWFAAVTIKRTDAESINSFCFKSEEPKRINTEFEIPTYPGGTKDPVRVTVNLGEEFVFDNEDSLYLGNLCESLEYSEKLVSAEFDIKYLVKLYSGSVLYAVSTEYGYVRRLDCSGENVILTQANLNAEQLSRVREIMLNLKTNL